jgi:hypothetical protein
VPVTEYGVVVPDGVRPPVGRAEVEVGRDVFFALERRHQDVARQGRVAVQEGDGKVVPVDDGMGLRPGTSSIARLSYGRGPMYWSMHLGQLARPGPDEGKVLLSRMRSRRSLRCELASAGVAEPPKWGNGPKWADGLYAKSFYA